MTIILAVVDRFSKMAYFIPLPKLPYAKETVNILIQHVFRAHRYPTDIVWIEDPNLWPSSGGSFAGNWESRSVLLSFERPALYNICLLSARLGLSWDLVRKFDLPQRELENLRTGTRPRCPSCPVDISA